MENLENFNNKKNIKKSQPLETSQFDDVPIHLMLSTIENADMEKAMVRVDNDCLREAFQSKKQQNLGISPNRGGESSKNQKSSKFQLGIVQS